MKKLSILILSFLVLFFIVDNVVNCLMMKGIENYYGLNQQSKILLIGHSHLMLAADKKRMESELGMKVSKYCREGVNVTDKKMMVEHFLNNGYSDSLKYVLYGVDLATFTGSGLSENSYKLFYPFIDDTYVKAYIKSQAQASDYWLHKLIKSSRFNDDGMKNSAVRGWCNNWDNFKTNRIDLETYKRKLANGDERRINMNEVLISQFTETVKMLTDRKIYVILINTPTLDLLNEFEPEKYAKIMQWYQTFANENEYVDFLDFNPQYSSDYSIFSDRLHLNRSGQQVITDEIVKYLSERES